RESGPRALGLDCGQDPDPGHAAQLFLPPAEHPSVRVYVPPRGDACRRAVAGGGLAAHVLSADTARYLAPGGGPDPTLGGEPRAPGLRLCPRPSKRPAVLQDYRVTRPLPA